MLTVSNQEKNMLKKDIDHRFTFHPPATPERGQAHEDVRDVCRGLADYLNATLPEGREKSLAITKLEELMFWSNAAIARSDA
jgi:hypothetical protein